MSQNPLRIGLLGVGVGARQLLPALTHHPGVRLTAAADLRPSALDQLHAEFDIQTFTSAEALCESNAVDAVWVASPNHLHAAHAIIAAQRGKHVIVSKPMAVTLAEADAMTAAAARHGVLLLAGHTQSMAPTVRRMADMVRVGELGALGMIHTWHFTDWMYRPRLPDELDTARGGGPVYRQASHQVDIVRTIGARRLRAVRAASIELDPSRAVPGAYSVYLEFDDGTPATIVYSGYGHLDMGAFLRGTETDAPADRAPRHRGRSAAQGGAPLRRGTSCQHPVEPSIWNQFQLARPLWPDCRYLRARRYPRISRRPARVYARRTPGNRRPRRTARRRRAERTVRRGPRRPTRDPRWSVGSGHARGVSGDPRVVAYPPGSRAAAPDVTHARTLPPSGSPHQQSPPFAAPLRAAPLPPRRAALRRCPSRTPHARHACRSHSFQARAALRVRISCQSS